MKYTIDAQGKKIGRVASEAASYLMGKNSVSFAKNTVMPVQVLVMNVDQASIPVQKKLDKKYVTYTGHRGGLNTETLGHLMDRRGMKEVMHRAIYRMLPNNKLRDQRIKNLIITA